MSTSARAARSVERRCWPLLLSLCRRDGPATGGNETPAREADGPALEEVCRLAARHGVLGLALSALERASRREGRTGPALPAAAARLLQMRRRAALIEMSRDAVATTLERAGVDTLMLKGAALAGTLYADPVERDVSDIDLLVPEDRVKTAVRALAAAGYFGPSSWKELCAFRRYHFHIPMKLPGAATVEVHWKLCRPDARFRLDDDDFRNRAIRITRPEAPPLRVPAPEHVLLHLVLQNVQEGFSRLGRIVDIDRLVASVPGLNWPALMSQARDGNLASALSLSLHLSRLLLGTPVPAEALAEARPGPVSRLHLAVLHAIDAPVPEFSRRQAARLLFDVWLAPGWALRRQMLLDILRPAAIGPSLKPGPSAFERNLILGKVVVAQALLVAAAPILVATPAGRSRSRLWSG